MPQAKITDDQRLAIFSLRKDEKGQLRSIDKIRKYMEERWNKGKGPKPPARRTIANYVKIYDDLKTEIKLRGRPFEWHKLEEYGLPWEASKVILQAHQWMQANYLNQVEHYKSLPNAIGEIYRPEFTVRQARWVWRISQALLGEEVGIANIYYMAAAFSGREIAHDLLDIPLEMADLEGILAWTPWKSDEHQEGYYKAVRAGIIPPVRPNALFHQHGDAQLDKTAVKTLADGAITNALNWPYLEKPHLLPLDAWEQHVNGLCTKSLT